MMRAAILAICLVATSACSKAPTVINGATPELFEKTTQKARRDLPIKDRLAFDAAMHNPAGRRYGMRDKAAMAREAYHGMTAFDVVADAEARGL